MRTYTFKCNNRKEIKDLSLREYDEDNIEITEAVEIWKQEQTKILSFLSEIFILTRIF